MTGLFGQIVAPTKAVLKQLLADKDLREKVTYRRFTGETFSATLKYNVGVYEETTGCKTIRLRHDSKSAAAAVAEIQAGDEVFVFLTADFPAGTSLKDQIKDGNGVTMKVKDIADAQRIATLVTVESGGLQ
uniref:Uncharacterized protein n=1 Tax=viral metagenome TaxID=1070528 RepID=A0A6M3X5H5_9ZZZZ